MDFTTLIERFERAAREHDTAALVALFAPDGRYHDGFFGEHAGRDALAAMFERFHVGGEAFLWVFSDPVSAGELAYASYVFSYRSKEPESAGRLVVFEGIARFRLRDGLIAEYFEVFDRGIAFSQLGYATPRVAKLLARYADALRDTPAVARHLERRRALGLPA
jgi:hypothetical protein